MDWRNRKYYTARFSYENHNYMTRVLKGINSTKLHCPTQSNYNERFRDEAEPRGYYQYLISCNSEFSDAVEFELRKSQRHFGYDVWKEIKQYQKPCRQHVDIL